MPQAHALKFWHLLALAAILFFLLAAYLARVQRTLSLSPVNEQLDSADSLRPTIDVSLALRSLKLITVEISTTVSTAAANESWRGDVSATVRAPVRFYYGTDLASLAEESVRFNPITRSYLVTLPRPHRLATEIVTDAESFDVSAGWLRFRSRSGEYYLGLARRALSEEARRMTLAPDDARRVADATRDQVTALVRAITGTNVPVDVVFIDPPPTRPAASANHPPIATSPAHAAPPTP